MKWLPQNPDMNPLENIWKIIGEKARNKNPQNINDLQDFLKEEWEIITGDVDSSRKFADIFVSVSLKEMR